MQMLLQSVDYCNAAGGKNDNVCGLQALLNTLTEYSPVRFFN